jgi:hypothetical protein
MPAVQDEEMPTWKRKDAEGTTRFQFLCSGCNEKKKSLLEQDAWILVRDTEPASCNDCDLQCTLTANQLWGATEEVRFAVCSRCDSYDRCPLQGRYYC